MKGCCDDDDIFYKTFYLKILQISVIIHAARSLIIDLINVLKDDYFIYDIHHNNEIYYTFVVKLSYPINVLSVTFYHQTNKSFVASTMFEQPMLQLQCTAISNYIVSSHFPNKIFDLFLFLSSQNFNHFLKIYIFNQPATSFDHTVSNTLNTFESVRSFCQIP